MLQERLAEQVNALIGPRLRLPRLFAFFAVALLEGLAQANQTIFDAYFWTLSEAASNASEFLMQLHLGDVVVLFVAAFFLVPRLASLLLSVSSSWAMAFAKPMFETLAQRRSDSREDVPPGELAKLVRWKRDGVRLSHAVGDLFEVSLLALLWMLWPKSHMGFSMWGTSFFAVCVAILWLMCGYAINYLIVTKVLPADVLAPPSKG